jgi:glutamyl-tRNA synthetase
VRLKRLTDAIPLIGFLTAEELPELTAADLTDKNLDLAAARRAFGEALDFVRTAAPYDLMTISAGLFQIGEGHSANGKAGPFLGKMRLAVTGQQVSPPLFESMLALGREKTAARLAQAVAALEPG